MLNVKFVTTLLAGRNDAIEWTPQGDMFRASNLEEIRDLATRMNYTMGAVRTDVIDVESGFTIETVTERVILND